MLNIQLKDAVILNVKTYFDHVDGCETCDYGSQYTTEIAVTYETKKGTDVKCFRQYQMYTYGINMPAILSFFHNQNLKEMTIEEFIIKFDEEVMNKT